MIFLYIPETRGESILLESGNLNETKLGQEPETPPTSILLFLWIPRWIRITQRMESNQFQKPKRV